MKIQSVLVTLLLAAGTASAQPVPNDPYEPHQTQPTPSPCAGCGGQVPSQSNLQAPELPQQSLHQPAPAQSEDEDDDTGWHRPVGRRFFHGFRMGWMYISHYDTAKRENGMTLQQQFKLTSPNMFVLGYEGFYRIVGHSWLNVLMVGNVTVAGLEQSKFLPAVSGLIGFEIEKSFQLGVGVNLTPDPQAPSHMIAAAGWTPKVGSIQTPVHFFYIPDTLGNNRMGATLGMNW